ncbi:MAG: dethiobiotin synthase [Desulfobacterium sp.]|nr:dethiobiotin synthase [Desulfobacterium sp.]
MTVCKKIAVIGTDTDVGKTVLSLLIMQALMGKGKTPFYIKPFQTGCLSPSDPRGDASFVYRHTPGLEHHDPSPSVLNCHENPKAPWFAARDMGETIDIDTTLARIREKEANHSHLVIEAAGGLLVPVTGEVTMVDFLKESRARPVIAARPGLGTINHTLMTVECLKARGITPAGIVFMDAHGDDDPLIQENMAAVARFSGVPVAGVVGEIMDFNRPHPGAVKVVEQLVKPFL